VPNGWPVQDQVVAAHTRARAGREVKHTHTMEVELYRRADLVIRSLRHQIELASAGKIP
jgi:hypothetical protein